MTKLQLKNENYKIGLTIFATTIKIVCHIMLIQLKLFDYIGPFFNGKDGIRCHSRCLIYVMRAQLLQ